MATRDGQPMRVDLPLPRPQVGGILREPAVDLRDGTRADAQQVLTAARGVAHEVAVQPSGIGGERQRIFGACEVIDADPPVPAVGEATHGIAEECKPLAGARQRTLLDALLVRLHPGNVRVTKTGHAIGGHGQRRLDGAREAAGGLPWQPVDEVEVEAGEPLGARQLDHVPYHTHRLHPADRFLHRLIDILHAVADAGEAELPEGAQLFPRHEPWVGFHRTFGARIDAEGVLQPGEQLLALPIGEKVGRAASPVHLAHVRTLAHGVGEHVEFAIEPREVAVHDLGARGHRGVAAAVETARRAEGEVHIQGEWRRAGAEHREMPRPRRVIERAAPVGYGRVTGIAGTGHIVPAEQRRGDLRHAHERPISTHERPPLPEGATARGPARAHCR